jgi:hypothetical protein
MKFGFNTEWTRFTDAQKQGRKKGMYNTNAHPTANEYFTTGPIEYTVSPDIFDRNRNPNWRKVVKVSPPCPTFIKVNGKEIF